MARIESFGSGRYMLALANSDLDLLYIVRPGQSRPRLKDFIEVAAKADSAFTQVNGRGGGDTVQFKFRGVEIDFKGVYLTRTSDKACMSTDCLERLVRSRPEYERNAVMMFKAVCHAHHFTHRHRQGRGERFQAIA